MSEKNRVYKKAREKTLRPWKAFASISGIIAIIFIPITYIVCLYDNTFAAYLGGKFWNLKDPNQNAIYFETDFNSEEELTKYGINICRRVEGEGAALLYNGENGLPLEHRSKVSLFSISCVNLVYGGTGSGNVDTSKADTLKDALEEEGFDVNPDLWYFYQSEGMKPYKRSSSTVVSSKSAVVKEVPWRMYSDELIDTVSEYTDAAIVVISRVGGEGSDLSYKDVNYLALNDEEKLMMMNIAHLKNTGRLKRIILLINSANPLQVDFMKNNEYLVDSVLWIGDTGISGINAVASILAGDVNPSGCLVDTYCYDNYSSPAMKNFTPIMYEGDLSEINENAHTYMIYQEGIYVGYRYYETRYEDYVMDCGNTADYHYDEDVAWPFGWGLSYTDFAISDMKVNRSNDGSKIYVTVKVTNTGAVYSGKRTVQVYSQSPYTLYDVMNHVEKSSVNLCGFAKTSTLKPGDSEKLTIEIDAADLASYDAYGEGTYISEEGDNYLACAFNAHEAVNNILAAKGYTPSNTDGRMDCKGNPHLVNKFYTGSFDHVSYSVSANGTRIENRLSSSDINLYEGRDGQKVTYLTRSNWDGTMPKEAVQLRLTAILKRDLGEVLYQGTETDVKMPAFNKHNDVNLIDLRGKDYSDSLWDELLDEMSFSEMVSLIGDSFHWTMPVESINAPGTRCENGPQGLTASLIDSKMTEMKATAFPSEDVMAATFNASLMQEIGRIIGNDCLYAKVMCLYGPGNNIHRTPYGGRNFEYFSEDPYLSGMMSMNEISAINKKGIHVVMKHFALNDCEQDRLGLGVWLNEQTAREIYLRAFQKAFEKASPGVMVAYTRWGPFWSGANKGLMTGILRNEWGSKGLNITDNVLVKYVNGADALDAGGISTFDAMQPYVLKQLPLYRKDPYIVSRMREACHHDLYTIVNSAAMNGMDEDTEVDAVRIPLEATGLLVSLISVCVFLISMLISILKYITFRKTYNYTRE